MQLDVRGIQKMLVKKTQQHNRELHSLRCDFQLKLRVAQDNRHEAAIYFPHNIDFRGRAYTIHPHLNHLGADTSRGLLMFADARPLGASGLKWLRIQVSVSTSPDVVRGAQPFVCAGGQPFCWG